MPRIPAVCAIANNMKLLFICLHQPYVLSDLGVLPRLAMGFPSISFKSMVISIAGAPNITPYSEGICSASFNILIRSRVKPPETKINMVKTCHIQSGRTSSIIGLLPFAERI